MYEVIVVGILLKNNQKAKGGDILDGSKFASDADELVRKGFLRKVEVNEAEAKEIEVNEPEVVESKPKTKK